jgi:hypothetical protein
MRSVVISLFVIAGILSAASPETELPILVEAEGFADTGGWVIDPQFMDLMQDRRFPDGNGRIEDNSARIFTPGSHFRLQHHDGETWQEVLPEVEENENPVWSATFAPVTTKYLRLVITQTPHNISRVWEIEFYHPLTDEDQ